VKRDLRAYARQTNVRLTAGAIFLLFGVGLGLIWVIYGGGAASLAFICFLSGLAVVGLILLVFLVIDWILKNARTQ
jgi:hypothetical protein